MVSSSRWIKIFILPFILTRADAECETYSFYINDEETRSVKTAICKGIASKHTYRYRGNTYTESLSSDVNILYITASNTDMALENIFGQTAYRLKELHITNSELEITNLKSEWKKYLAVIVISANNIKTIPRNLFSGFRKLRLLNISRNSLESMQFIGNGSNFFAETLDLSYNKISNINGQLTVMTQIKDLNLSGNLIRNISVDCFSNLDQLVSLNLAENHMTHVPSGTFTRLRSLTSLNLSGNKISLLTLEMFSGLNSLNAMDLSSNNISSVSAEVLYNLNSIKSFSIKNNSFTDINIQEIMDYLPLLQRIALEGNNLTCSKLWEIMWILREKSIVLEPGGNFEKKNFNGISCTDDANDEEYAVIRNVEKAGQNPNFALKTMRRYFERDFKQSQFFKFFDEKLLKRFDEAFKNAHLFKHVDDDLVNSEFYKYFTYGYINSTFFEYLNKKIEAMEPFSQTDKAKGYQELLKKTMTEYFNPNLKPNSDDSGKGEKSEDFNILIALVFILLSLCVMFGIFLCKYIGCVKCLKVRDSKKLVRDSEDHIL